MSHKKIVLATSNSGKIKEFNDYLSEYEVIPFGDIIEPFEIKESGKSYKENAIIKAEAVYKKVKDKDLIVLADDSGITVPALGEVPGIYSARFAGEGASAKENLEKLINELKIKKIARTPAFYTAAIAIACKQGTFCVHGWMHGEVIDEARGDKGFGYDPMFIPHGYEKTLGELDKSVKEQFSHRSKALKRALILLSTFKD